jgi:hypothetical protein
MVLGAVDNTIFVNQMSANVTSVPNAHNNRIELQNVMAQAMVNEQDEKVLEVRPTEENHGVDPDREHQRDEIDRESERSEKREKKDDEEESKETPHHLDIMV